MVSPHWTVSLLVSFYCLEPLWLSSLVAGDLSGYLFAATRCFELSLWSLWFAALGYSGVGYVLKSWSFGHHSVWLAALIYVFSLRCLCFYMQLYTLRLLRLTHRIVYLLVPLAFIFRN